jgi:hypothetical protein
MAKLSLTDIAAGYALVATYNANNALIEAALENTLSRDGTTPNTMSADLDMNSNSITNLGTPANDSDVASKEYVDDAVAAAELAANAATVNEATPYDFTNQIDFSGAGGIRILDTGLTDSVEFSHDGTDLNLVATTTTSIKVSGLGAGFHVEGGDLRAYDSGNTNYIRARHDGTTGIINVFPNGDDLIISVDKTQSVIQLEAAIKMVEITAPIADTAGYGQLWVKDDTPNSLYFTDDAGTDVAIVESGAVATRKQLKMKATDETVSTDTTLTADSDLAGFAMDANSLYKFEGYFSIDANSATPDLKFDLSFTNAPQLCGQDWTINDNGTVTGDSQNLHAAPDVIDCGGNTPNVYVHLSGMIQSNATTGGTFDLRWAQNVSDASAIGLEAGSWLSIEKI